MFRDSLGLARLRVLVMLNFLGSDMYEDDFLRCLLKSLSLLKREYILEHGSVVRS